MAVTSAGAVISIARSIAIDAFGFAVTHVDCRGEVVVFASTVDFFQAAPEAEAFVVCYLTNELATHLAI